MKTHMVLAGFEVSLRGRPIVNIDCPRSFSNEELVNPPGRAVSAGNAGGRAISRSLFLAMIMDDETATAANVRIPSRRDVCETSDIASFVNFASHLLYDRTIRSEPVGALKTSGLQGLWA